MAITRTEAAYQIQAALDAAGYDARVWTGGNAVRVYVKDGRQRRPLGHIEMLYDGRASPSLSRQKGDVMGHVPEMEVEPFVPAPREQVERSYQDEDVAQFERSERATGASEAAREEG